MIPVSGLKNQNRIVRETTAPFITVDKKGEETTEQITVRYFSFSISEGRQFLKGIEELGSNATLVDHLFPMLDGLPDFCDDAETPVKITKEFLEGLNTINIQAILKSIREDASPK
jgi:hypothetical protein